MKRIAFFCIPAHGHTNPMLPVAAELVKRGDSVRFYSFDEFEEKIRSTGAEFVSCNEYLPPVTDEEMENLMNVNTTEMTIQDIRTTLKMNDFLDKEFAQFKPDAVYSDSVCFWGKLNAWKHKVPLVCSTSTFAFNQMSSKYMKMSSRELSGMIFGLPKISKELKTLEPYGYHVKSALSLVQNDNKTDTVVYTSRSFQPYAESFSDHYTFVGPSVFSTLSPDKSKDRPLIYIALGTVINDRPDFYHKCMAALGNTDIDVIISYGKHMDKKLLGKLPGNVQAYPYVNQLEVLSKADAFITHCGMNSVSEGLYMATPLILYPQTSEQRAVARRVTEKEAGIMLNDDSAEGIKQAVTQVLNDSKYAAAAKSCCDDFRSCPSVKGAADFIENAPHTSCGTDLLTEVNRGNKWFYLCYWLIACALMALWGFLISWQFVWIIGIVAGVLSHPISGVFFKMRYNKLAKSRANSNGV
ncbi:MAG: macrolide family glycosyltransferase [Ruminococcus sp.]|nr:macrolide family glycosyltransferase [Ruminococcus sp.]